MKKFLVGLGLALSLGSFGAFAALICPTTSSTNSDCGYILTINADGSITGAAVASAAAYDGSDDSLVGVINNSDSTFTGSIHLTGSGSDGGIFAFDSDGICDTTVLTGDLTYCASLPGGSSGYEGPLNTFANITTTTVTADTGDVVITGLGAGATTFFSLEGAPDDLAASVTVGAPEPATLSLLGSALLGMGMLVRRKRSQR